MPDYRRADIPGGSYFFTLVTYQRQNLLCNDEIRAALRDAIRTTQMKWPFVIDAWVLMPDHLHAIWTLPVNDNSYSKRWSTIKRLVTKRVDCFDGISGAHGAPYGGNFTYNQPLISPSRNKRREGSLWQRRFWEHVVRDEADLNRCRDYLHWNPVKHGHVSRVADWPYSSFHRFVRERRYPDDWGGGNVKDLDEGAFGE